MTSRPRARAPPIILRHSGASAVQLLLIWTMCRDAPVTADAAMTSPTDSMLEPGSSRPELRTCTKTGTRRDGRHAKRVNRLRARGPRRVDEAHADAQRAGVDCSLEPRADGLQFGVAGHGFRSALAGRHDRVRGDGAAEGADSRPGMAGRRAEVDRRLAAPRVENAATSGAPISSSSAVVTPSCAARR